jgi:IMP dehydrogenase
MSTGHAALPRGVRIHPGVDTTLDRLLNGPTSRTDGSENLVGAIRTCMGMVGAQNMREFHEAELIVAPSIKTEGKLYQMAAAAAR